MLDKRKLGDITCGEWDAIKRRRDGLTQAAVAREEGVDRLVVVRREKNSTPHPQRNRIKVTHGEWCFIMRVRAGLTQAQIGDTLGLSSFWVREMEADRQSPERLVAYFVGNPM